MNRSPRANIAALTFAAAALAACNGGGNEGVGDDGATTFRAYALAHASGDAGGSLSTLSAADQVEVASKSRMWAASTLVTGDSQFPGNAVTLPSLYFGRLQAVVGAASGATLAELRNEAPVPSTDVAAAALMRGLSRTVSAGPDALVTNDFMRILTASSQPTTWASLELKQLSSAALAAEPNLRLTVSDQFSLSVPWQQVTVFDGVFDAGGGTRVQAPMLRIVGPLVSFTDSRMQAVAMAAPRGRWLLRLTPVGPLSTWTADDLASAIARAVAAVANSASSTVEGEFLLPVLSGFRPLGIDDKRGMDSAQDPVRADLRALDGMGGTFVQLPTASASLNLSAQGLSIFGASTTEFIYSPSNIFSAGAGFQLINLSPSFLPIPCAATDLRPAYLVLVNDAGGIDMLARFTSVAGIVCS